MHVILLGHAQDTEIYRFQKLIRIRDRSAKTSVIFLNIHSPTNILAYVKFFCVGSKSNSDWKSTFWGLGPCRSLSSVNAGWHAYVSRVWGQFLRLFSVACSPRNFGRADVSRIQFSEKLREKKRELTFLWEHARQPASARDGERDWQTTSGKKTSGEGVRTTDPQTGHPISNTCDILALEAHNPTTKHLAKSQILDRCLICCWSFSVNIKDKWPKIGKQMILPNRSYLILPRVQTLKSGDGGL